MNWEEFHKEHKDLDVPVEQEDIKKRSPIAYILGVFVILVFTLSIIPHYAVALDPSPKDIPALQDVVPTDLVAPNEYYPNIYDAAKNVNPADPQIKQIAAEIASKSCTNSKICQAKALFYFTRDNIVYVSDPKTEYVEYPLETLKTGAADCDGQAILLAVMQEAIGVDARIALIPGHAYVEIQIDGISKKYQNSDGWVPLDPTCKSCDFGEIPEANMLKDKNYLII